ncbi:15356_t:CDS:2, partial [Acaulospora colombiana]
TSLPGAIRLPEDNNHSSDEATVVAKGRQKIAKAVQAWNPNLRRVTILGITLVTQLGFFIVLMPSDDFAVMLVDATSALFLVIPFATFMHKLHWSIPSTFTLVFIGTFFFSLFTFPFTYRAPAYLEFEQVVSLDNGTNIVLLAGPRGYTENDIVPHLPSFKASTDLHRCKELPMGLAGQPESTVCLWHGLAPPEPPIDLLTVEQSHLIGDVARVWVNYAPGCTGYGLEFQGPAQPQWEGVSRSEEKSGR